MVNFLHGRKTSRSKIYMVEKPVTIYASPFISNIALYYNLKDGRHLEICLPATVSERDMVFSLLASAYLEYGAVLK